MTRIAIAADLHADDYAGIPGRYDDILGTIRWVANEAVVRGADALVVAGDYTESKAPVRAARAVQIASALAVGPSRQFHVRGNHDVEWRGKSIVDDLARTPGWTGFGSAPGFDLVDDVAICCIPFLDKAWWRAQPGNELKPEAEAYRELGRLYPVIAAGLYARAMDAGAAAAILVGHQQLAGGRMTERQQVFLGDLDTVVDPRSLAIIGYSAVVFGHVHRAQVVLDDPACPVLFAGSVERVDFAEEAEEKSFVLLDVEPGKPVSIERIPTPARRFVTLTGEVDGIVSGPGSIDGAIARVVDVDPDEDLVAIRRTLEAHGAFAVTTVRPRPVDPPAAAGGLSEASSAEELLSEYFADDPDRDALVEIGRGILAEVAS